MVKLLTRFKIRSKLLILVAVMAALTIVITFTGVYSILTIFKRVEFSAQTLTIPMEDLARANFAYGQMMLQTRDLSILTSLADSYAEDEVGDIADAISGATGIWTPDEESTTYAEEQMKNYVDAINAYYDAMVIYGVTDGEDFVMLNQIIASSNEILPMIQNCIDLAKIGESGRAAQIMLLDVKPKTDALNEALQSLMRYNGEKTESLLAEAHTMRNRSMIAMALTILIGGLIVAPIVLLIVFAIVNPIEIMSEVAVMLMEGKIDIEFFEEEETKSEEELALLEKKTKDEIAILGRNFGRMRQTIRNLSQDIQVLIQNANDGKLNARAEIGKYSGGWNHLMKELNRLLDNIIVPMQEASGVLRAIANGDLKRRVTGLYRGDFALLKESVNETAIGIESYIDGIIRAERVALESDNAKRRSEAARKVMLDSIRYARRIQSNLLPRDSLFTEAFSDSSVVWNPRDIVGGDIYWIQIFEAGTVLCVCDCTGHGTPGALLTMLVVSALQDLVDEENCQDPATIIWELDQRLAGILTAEDEEGTLDIRDGCDLAVLFIAKNGDTLISSGHIHVFVCDGTEVTQIRGQNIYAGSGKLTSKEQVKVSRLPYKAENKFYIATDGLYDQVSDKTDLPFGYRYFKELILAHHEKKQEEITDEIWNAFELYKGSADRLDDFELISFRI